MPYGCLTNKAVRIFCMMFLLTRFKYENCIEDWRLRKELVGALSLLSLEPSPGLLRTLLSLPDPTSPRPPRYRGAYSKGELEFEGGQSSLLLKSEVPRSEVWRSWLMSPPLLSFMLSRLLPNLEAGLRTLSRVASASMLRPTLSRGPWVEAANCDLYPWPPPERSSLGRISSWRWSWCRVSCRRSWAKEDLNMVTCLVTNCLLLSPQK